MSMCKLKFGWKMEVGTIEKFLCKCITQKADKISFLLLHSFSTISCFNVSFLFKDFSTLVGCAIPD